MSADLLKGLMNCETLQLGAGNALAKPKFFVFRMEPIPKGRPRAGITKTGKAFLFTPEQTRQYEEQIRKATRFQFPNSRPLTGDLTCFMHFYCTDKRAGDIDNLAKAILDGMQTVAFGNDSQIKTLFLEMHIVGQDSGEARTEVTVCRRKSDAEYEAEEVTP